MLLLGMDGVKGLVRRLWEHSLWICLQFLLELGSCDLGGRLRKDVGTLRKDMAFLQELERDHGRKKAAAILGVDPRTLDTGLDERMLSRRMRAALERALRVGVGPEANNRGSHADEMEDRADTL